MAQFTRTDGEKSSRDDASTILFIGRLVPEKGQGVLLEATAVLAERGHNVRVIIAGDGPWRDEVERHAQRLGVASQISFHGAVGQDEIHAMYASASIFCLPSFAEGVPGVLMEALAMELPVVTTRITGIAELVDDGHSGLLVSPSRSDELADALERLLTDPSLRKEMGLRAREKVLREFNTDISAERLCALFAEELIE
jgi:glycosyltransferase involved in cell wall biosynthesis